MLGRHASSPPFGLHQGGKAAAAAAAVAAGMRGDAGLKAGGGGGPLEAGPYAGAWGAGSLGPGTSVPTYAAPGGYADGDTKEMRCWRSGQGCCIISLVPRSTFAGRGAEEMAWGADQTGLRHISLVVQEAAMLCRRRVRSSISSRSGLLPAPSLLAPVRLLLLSLSLSLSLSL